MIKRVNGNILNATSGILAHGCNAQGVMGSGIAKTLRDADENIFLAYRNVYDACGLELGDVIYVPFSRNKRVYVANCITQEFYRGFVHKSGTREPNDKVFVSYDAVASCFSDINETAKQLVKDGATDPVINFPMIGAGLANGDIDVILEIIDRELDDFFEKVLWIYK